MISAFPESLDKSQKGGNYPVINGRTQGKKQNMIRSAGLQMLRVIACIGVFLCHLGSQMGVEGTLEKIMDFGARGVYLFFILSGYFGFCSRELENEDKKKGCLCYFIKRAFKILPLYYVLILYNLVLYEFILKSAPVDSSGIGWPRYFLLISTWIPADKNFWVNLCSTWTVGIFVLFYLFVPLLKRYVVSLKGAAVLWGGLYLLSYFCLGKVDYGMPVFYLHYFVLGIMFYFSNKEGKERELVIGCIAFALGSIAINRTLTHNACSMLFLILIIMAKEIRIENERLQRIVNMMDSYSYTIYLTHAVVMDGIEMIKNRYPVSPNMVLLIGIGCTVSGCFIARHLVEIPMERLGKKCLLRIKKGPDAAEGSKAV